MKYVNNIQNGVFCVVVIKKKKIIIIIIREVKNNENNNKKSTIILTDTNIDINTKKAKREQHNRAQASPVIAAARTLAEGIQ